MPSKVREQAKIVNRIASPLKTLTLRSRRPRPAWEWVLLIGADVGESIQARIDLVRLAEQATGSYGLRVYATSNEFCKVEKPP